MQRDEGTTESRKNMFLCRQPALAAKWVEPLDLNGVHSHGPTNALLSVTIP